MWLCLLVLLGLYFLFRWHREKKMIPHLPDKYVLITGCDSGFGNLLARQLDRLGLFVLAACFTQEGAEQLKEAASRRLQTVILDVSDSGSVAAMAHWVKRQVGDKGLWGLVNNAGTGIPGAPNEWLTKDDFVRVLNVNLLGTIDVTLNLLPLVRKARGRVVVVSSIVGRITFCGGGYCISKFGLEAFSDSLRRELCHFGVKVSIIEPGYFKTQLNVLASMKAQLSDLWGRLPPSVKESYGQEYFDRCLDPTMWLYLATLLGLYLLFRWYRECQTVPNLHDKHVLITGCDSGFGNLLAKQLDRRGMCVLAACLTQKGAEQLKEATSERLQTVILDVTISDSVAAMAKWVKQHVADKGLWGLVNNAGVGFPMAPTEWLTKDDFAKVINVNLLGLIDVTVNLLPLVRQARGRIVNVSSSLGRIALPGGGYCPSKYGVEAFSDSLRRDLREFGVKVSIVEPGAFYTGFSTTQIAETSLKTVWDRLTKEVKETYGEQYFDTYCKNLIDLSTTGSTNLHLVVDTMQHGITAVHPRTRYSPGWDSKFFYIPLSYFPTIIVDYVLTRSSPRPAK